MTGLARLILRQRSAVLLLAAILLVAGGVTATRMQQELFPNISFDTISVVTADPGADPTSVLNDVTKPIEVAVAGVPGINTLTSTSSQNASVVVAQFNYGTDINQAEAKIAAAVSALSLPSGVQAPKVSTIDFSAFPIMYLAVKNNDARASLQQTYTLVNTQVKPQLEQIGGVAAADVSGGANPRVTITLHPAALARYGLTVAQVDAILQANNIGIPAGNVTNNGVTQPVVTTGKLTTLAQIRDLPITVQGTGAAMGRGAAGGRGGFSSGRSMTPGSGGGTGVAPVAPRAPHLIYLKDIATISQGQGDISTLGTTPGQIAGIVRVNGQPGISISIRKNSDANIVTVADAVTAKVKDLQKQYPQLHISTLYDSSTSIKESIGNLLREGSLGALFAIVVIFVFLLTVRSTLVTAISIPLSICIAILILGSQGITLNIMTISAIAVAVGRVVDDAIVVLENIFRHIQLGENRRDAVVNGTAEVGRAILGSTITTVAVFLPIAFVGGLIGQFFAPFALTVTFALIASLLVALTVVPALGSLLIRKKKSPPRETIFQRVYTPLLTWGLGHRAITVVIALVLFVGSVSLVSRIPTGFLPPSNETIAQVSVNLPAGASLGRTTGVVARVEREVIAKQPGISEWETIIGYDNTAAQRFGNSNASNAASMIAVYSTNTDMTKAVERLNADLKPYNTGGTVIKGEAVQGGPPNNVDVQVTGANQGDVTAATQQVLAKLRGVSGLTDLQSNLQTRQPQVNIAVDPRKAFLHGLTPATAAMAIRQQLTGQTVTTVRLNGQTQDADIFVQVDPNAGNTVAKIKALLVGTPPVAVGQIATVSPGYGPVNIARQGQQNIGEVTAGVGSSTSTGTVTNKVSSAINALSKTWSARNVTIQQAGVGKQLTDSFINMAFAMLVAIGLVYLIMVILFRSLLVPFVILFALPLAAIGALIALFVTQHELDLSAMIGMLMLIGIVVTNAIVLLDLVQHKIEAGDDLHTALVEGGRTRVRPILMTATATILALVPLALSSGGGLIAANLAIVVIGGLLSSTLLTLVVVPVIYSLLVSLRRTLTGGGLEAAAPMATKTARDGRAPERVAAVTER
ncbi:MAG TPA: efflux RND transporter permease subunit [Chloroflexota bacterium]|nr:efflux RND transporter permease subunit [Chloroflexota bacterium]